MRTRRTQLTADRRGTLFSATMKGHFFSLSRLMDSSVWGSKPCMMSTTRMAMSHRELPRFLRLLEVNATTNQNRLSDFLFLDLSQRRWSEPYLKDSCPGVSMISMPGIFRFSLSNCSNTNVSISRASRKAAVASLDTRASPYVLNHLGLLHNGLLGDVCGSDLLRDSSGLAVLNVSVSQLHTPKETTASENLCATAFVLL